MYTPWPGGTGAFSLMSSSFSSPSQISSVSFISCQVFNLVFVKTLSFDNNDAMSTECESRDKKLEMYVTEIEAE
jgi:hypothetical protein